MQWLAGLSFGIATHLLFGWTVWQLFFFLRDGSRHTVAFSPAVDVLLCLQFAVLHSLLLWPPTARRLRRWIPGGLYGCLFSTVTCICLLTAIGLWAPSSDIIWQLTGLGRFLVLTGFYASWIALIYSMSLTGL